MAFCLTAFAQITITRQGYTVSGVVVDTSRFRDIQITNLEVPVRGGNRTYDYTGIRDTILQSNQVNTPAVQSNLPPRFVGATFVFRPQPALGTYAIPDTQYLKLDNTGYFIMGYRRGNNRGVGVSVKNATGNTADSLWYLPRERIYTQTPFLIKLPMTSTTVSKTSVLDTFGYQLTFTAAGLNKANLTWVRKIDYSTEVIGWGTLRMRNSNQMGGILSFGVLFERYAEIRTDNYFLNGGAVPARVLDTFRLEQGRIDTTAVTYNLRGNGFKRGILQFRMSADESRIIGANRVIEITQGINVNTDDLKSFDVQTTVFPNPSTDRLSLRFEKKSAEPWQLMLYTEGGQIIDLQRIEGGTGLIQKDILLDKSLPSGLYFYQITDDISLIRSQGKFTVVR
jgi:hypothetical protein